jgi:ABC-type uncharacterized transport system ATPase component
MLDTTQNALRALLPHASEEELLAANNCLERYLNLAIEIASAGQRMALSPVLTKSDTGVNVVTGQVDPRTFTNTG